MNSKDQFRTQASIMDDMRKKILDKFVEEMGEPGKPKIRVVNLRRAADYVKIFRVDRGQSMYVYVKEVRPDKYKNPNYNYSYVRDPENDVYYGIVTGFLPDGNPKWRRFPVHEVHTLNLARVDDAIFYIFLSMHPNTVGSPWEVADPIHEIYDEEMEAIKKIEKNEQVKIALSRVQRIPIPERVNFARCLGLSIPDSVSLSVITSKIESVAIEDPLKFNTEYENPLQEIKRYFLAALDYGLITVTNKGYIYLGYELGLGESSAIYKLEKSLDILGRLKGDVESKDILSKRVVKDAVKQGIYHEETPEIKYVDKIIDMTDYIPEEPDEREMKLYQDKKDKEIQMTKIKEIRFKLPGTDVEVMIFLQNLMVMCQKRGIQIVNGEEVEDQLKRFINYLNEHRDDEWMQRKIAEAEKKKKREAEDLPEESVSEGETPEENTPENESEF